jgi:hypothetical protein
MRKGLFLCNLYMYYSTKIQRYFETWLNDVGNCTIHSGYVGICGYYMAKPSDIENRVCSQMLLARYLEHRANVSSKERVADIIKTDPSTIRTLPKHHI